MSDKEEKSNKGKSKPRSPAYPGIPLEEAITRARQIYNHERENKAYVSVIYSHWGYKVKSGNARVTLASLKYYGLIKIEGSGDSRNVQLTDLALDILLDERENSSERENAIKRAALSPTINSDLWNKFKGNLPSNQNLKFTLQRELGFTDRGVEEFLMHFHRTLEYANLHSQSDTPEHEEGKSDKEEETKLSAGQVSTRGSRVLSSQPELIRNIQLPLSSDSWATLSANFPLTEDSWNQMLVVLQAMKPALIKNKDQTEED